MSAGILAPFIAELPSNATGQVEAIQAASVAFTGIEYMYFVNASLASSTLFSAFTVNDADSGTSADVTVSIDKDAFKTALRGLMAAATGSKLSGSIGINTAGLTAIATGGSDTLDVTLREEIRAEIAVELNSNGVLETLEADAVNDLEMVVNWSGGADNMATGLDNPDMLKAMYLQLPQRAVAGSVDHNAAGNTSFTFAQIMQADDRMAFVFHAAPEVAVTAEAVNVVTGSSSTANPEYNGNGAQIADPSVTFTSGDRRIAFIIKAQA